jgi:glycosyltransferase 2 family protein
VVSWAIRLGAGVVLLAVLFYFGLLNLQVLSRTLNHPQLLALAVLLIVLSVPMGALRWWLLLNAQQFPMSLWWALRVTLIGQFLNTFMPGAYGGDVARLALAYKTTRRNLSRLTFTVFVDRMSGLISLILLGLMVLPVLPLSLRGQTFMPLVIASLTMAAAVTLGLLWGARIASLVERVPKIGPMIAHAIREVLAAFNLYLGKWQVLCAALAISLVQFVLILVSLGVIGTAMDMRSLPFSGYMIAGIWSIIANAIPLTPGGLGIGEIAFARMAAMLEPVPSGASYATVFLAMRVLTVLVSALGVIPYLPRRLELRRDMAAVQDSSGTGALKASNSND